MPRAEEKRILTFRYRFFFPNAEPRDFTFALDSGTLALRPEPRESWPSWTRLGYFQCTNCPLDERRSPRCPIAANIVDVVAFFRDHVSHEEVDVEVEAHGRAYRKRVSLQEALSSMLGIVMVTAGCPVLNRLRPMVATHLPFMSSEESTYRVVSMYLLAQHFISRAGGSADWDLDGLVDFLEEVRRSNQGFCSRLKSLKVQDALLNAVAVLDAQGEVTSLTILEDDLGRWRRVFLEHFLPGYDPQTPSHPLRRS